MTTDWIALVVQGVVLCATIGGPISVGLIRLTTKVAVLTTKVDLLDKELRGNGSIPPRCAKHDQQLQLVKQQLQQLAGGE